MREPSQASLNALIAERADRTPRAFDHLPEGKAVPEQLFAQIEGLPGTRKVPYGGVLILETPDGSHIPGLVFDHILDAKLYVDAQKTTQRSGPAGPAHQERPLVGGRIGTA